MLDRWIDRWFYPTGTFVEAMVPNCYTHGLNDRFFNSGNGTKKAICLVGHEFFLDNKKALYPKSRRFYVITENVGIRVVDEDLVRIIRKLSKKEEFAARLKGLELPEENFASKMRPPK
jgi:hypothetical protein